MFRLSCRVAALVLLATLISLPAAADTQPAQIGIVIMHGKGGSPHKLVAELAASLANKGYAVANLEMPWSGKRQYDADVSAAEQEVESALSGLRSRGATRVFVAGHSQGGLFALYFGGKHDVDGIIAIAPGGNVASSVFREKLSESLNLAQQLVTAGKGADKVQFYDFEGSKGTIPINTSAAYYLSWFSPEGAMNQNLAMRNMLPGNPVLYIAPTRDYPGLLKVKHAMFSALPHHPLTTLHEPDAGHIDAPIAALDEIVRWTHDVSRAADTAR